MTLNKLRNHGGINRAYCGIIKCTSRAFDDVCGETCPWPGTLAYLRAITPAASSLKNRQPPSRKNSVCLPSHRRGSTDVKGWLEREGEQPIGQSGEVHPLGQGVGTFKAGKEGAGGGFRRKYNGGMLPSKGCAGHIANLAMILVRQSQSNPREADPWTSVSHCASANIEAGYCWQRII